MWQKKFKKADFGVCSYSGCSEYAASPSLFRGPTRESVLVLRTDTEDYSLSVVLPDARKTQREDLERMTEWTWAAE